MEPLEKNTKQEAQTAEQEAHAQTAEEASLAAPKKKRFADSLRQLWQKLRNVFQEYPVTMGCIMLAALIGAILISWNNRDTEIYPQRAVVFCLITAAQTLFFEEWFGKKKLQRIIGIAFSALIAVVFTYILSSDVEILFSLPRDTVDEITGRLLAVYTGAMIGMGIYHMFRRLEDDFEIYATKAFLELLKATVVYGLFALGLAILIWIFNELIFDTDDFLSQVELFLAGGIYVPMCLKAISGKNTDAGKFARFCIHYVLQPLLLIAYAIIYIYIVKIFVTDTVPSNQVFYILAFLFSLGMPIWTMIHGTNPSEKKDWNTMQRISDFIPYAFLPFVLLQCYCIGVRIHDYGVTVDRYAAVILILCECIYFALYFLRSFGHRRAISHILPALILVSAFVFLIPGTSYDDVVIRSQMKNLKAQLQTDKSSDAAMGRIKETYNVIRRVGFKGEKALEKQLSQGQIAEIKTYQEYYNSQRRNIYLSDYHLFSNVDISAYRSIYYVTASSYTETDGKKIRLIRDYEDNGSNSYYEIDLSSLVDWAAENFSEASAKPFSLKGREKYRIDETMDLFIDQISLTLNAEKGTLNRITLSGYILER